MINLKKFDVQPSKSVQRKMDEFEKDGFPAYDKFLHEYMRNGAIMPFSQISPDLWAEMVFRNLLLIKDSALETLLTDCWDGKPRLNNWFSTYCQVPDLGFGHHHLDVRLYDDIAAKLVLAMVARQFNPGIKYQVCPTFIGPNGSQILEAITPQGFYGQGAINWTLGDSVHKLVFGKMLVGLPGLKCKPSLEYPHLFFEITDFRKRRRWRPLRCVFAGAVQREEQIHPKLRFNWRLQRLHFTKVDLHGLKEVMPQIWAEAVARWTGSYNEGPQRLWLEPESSMTIRDRAEEFYWNDRPGYDLIKPFRP